MSSAYPNYPPKLSQFQEEELVSAVKQWSSSQGLVVRPSPSFVRPEQDRYAALVTTAPVTLFPSLFPQSCFEEGIEIQEGYNEIYARIAADDSFLQSMVNVLGQIDDFIANLWNVHIQVKEEGYAQDLTLGIFRSDYMAHHAEDPTHKPILRQVEFNTIASSFGGLSNRVSSLHRYLLKSQSYPPDAASTISNGILPENTSIMSIAAGMASAYSAYGSSKAKPPLTKCLLFVVQDDERNIFDQKHIEHELFDKHNILVFRLPWTHIMRDTRIGKDRILCYTPPTGAHQTYEATVVYFRAGYSPNEYTGPESWKARAHLERSAAIKCPSILTHLAGSKKVQQILASPKSPWLKRFLPNEVLGQRILNTFAPMFPLDDSEAGRTGQKLALNPETAERYVLKPQREGGGNNIYRKNIPEFLMGMPKDKWVQYVLMEMIETTQQRNSILRNGEVQSGDVICELGVYGTCVWRRRSSGTEAGGLQEIVTNNQAGYLLRTKGGTSEEGGVAAGFGAVDSCCLVDSLQL